MNSNFVKASETSNWKPIIWFLVLAYGISYTSFFLRRIVESPDLDQFLRLVTKFGPSIAGIIATIIFLKQEDLKKLLSRTFALKIHFRWYLIVLLFPLLPALLSAFLYLIFTNDPISENVAIDATPLVYLGLLARFTFTGGGLGEELGWRGFMLPFLQDKLNLSPLNAAVYIGIAHAFWHFPAYGFATIIFAFFAVALSIIMVWIFNNSRQNVWLMILLHGGVNASLSFTEDLFPSLDNNMVVVVMIMAIWGLAAFFIGNKMTATK